MAKDRQRSAGSSTSAAGPLKPVEITYTFAVNDRHGEPRTFDVVIDLLDGQLDLAVTFKGAADELSLLPAELIDAVQTALTHVWDRVMETDLVERDD